jgi:hypothetical protein
MASIADELEGGLGLLVFGLLAFVVLYGVGVLKKTGDSLPKKLADSVTDEVTQKGKEILNTPWSPAQPGDDGYDDPNYQPGIGEQASNAVEPIEKSFYDATNPFNLLSKFDIIPDTSKDTASDEVPVEKGSFAYDPTTVLEHFRIF